MDETAYTQPALFALEYALAKLWESWGVVPDVVMGHSVGELVAACVAGVFSLEDGLKLIAERGRLMQLCERGEMVAVFASEAQLSKALEPYTEDVSIAAINGPQSVVISGTRDGVRHVVTELEALGINTKRLAVSHAVHSPLVERILADFLSVARQISFSPPKACPEARGITFISNMTGQLATNEISRPEYWVRHVRQPVRFQEGMVSLVEQETTVFVEIGPKPVLLGMGRRLYDHYGSWLPSLRPDAEWRTMLTSVAQLYVQGVKIDWVGFDQDYAKHRRRVVLPTYPFERQRYWIEAQENDKNTRRSLINEQISSQAIHPLLGHRLHSPLREIQFRNQITVSEPAFINDHKLHDTVIVPGVAYLSMALAAAREALGSAPIMLEEVLIQEALILSQACPDKGRPEVNVQTILTPDNSNEATFQILR